MQNAIAAIHFSLKLMTLFMISWRFRASRYPFPIDYLSVQGILNPYNPYIFPNCHYRQIIWEYLTIKDEISNIDKRQKG